MSTGGEGDYGVDGTMWTLTFTIPADAEEGEVFPLDIVYQSAGTTKDAFFDVDRTEAGMLMEAYAFTQGIYSPENPTFAASAEDVAKCPNLANIDSTYDGYIAIAGAVETTTTTVATTTTTKAATTTGKKGDSPKTGVAGVGVAAAGLAVAIGTAFVLRKKED